MVRNTRRDRRSNGRAEEVDDVVAYDPDKDEADLDLTDDDDVDLDDADLDDADPDDADLDDTDLDDPDLDDADLADDEEPEEDLDVDLDDDLDDDEDDTPVSKNRSRRNRNVAPARQSLAARLYSGEVSFDFIKHQKIFYLVSLALVLASLAVVGVRGFNLGIEFKGGADFQVNAAVNDDTVGRFTDAVSASGVRDLGEVTVRTIGDNRVRIQTRSLNSQTEVPQIQAAIAQEAGVPTTEVAYSLIGATWGGQITQQALIALAVFLALVSLIIAIYFRNWKMSLAALIALGHDLVITVGVYAAANFVVTPATVIGVLTILGYSLYDTVVVFDKVRENTANIVGQTTRTYAEAANLAVNQVLVRSINTTVIGVLPVAALLIAGVFILGEGPLKDLALALFVGMIAGAYSSLVIATPLLVWMKMREPELRKHARRVMRRRGSDIELNDDDEGSAKVRRELVAAGAGGGRGTVSRAEANRTRTVSRGGAGRPQPVRKPRQRRK